jgi:AcrR family transcriptional regulator
MERRTELLRAAARVYAKHGYRGSTTRRIADEAGVNEVTIFRQFGSKDALMHEAIATCGGSGEAPELPAIPGDPVAELTEWSGAIMQQLRETRELIRRCMSERDEHPTIASASSSTAPRASIQLRAYLQRLQDAGIVEPEVDVKAASALLMGALFSDAMGRDWMTDVFPTTPRDAAGQYTRMMLRAAGVTDASVVHENSRALFTDVT